MKKRIIKIILILICFFFVLYIFTGGLSPQAERIDISQFKGRILPAYKINPGTFTLTIPFSEALISGEDAILSYSEQGIIIWKPDKRTSGIFLSAKKHPSSSSYYYEVNINNNEIIVSEKIHISTYFFSLLVTILIILFIIVIRKINLKKKIETC